MGGRGVWGYLEVAERGCNACPNLCWLPRRRDPTECRRRSPAAPSHRVTVPSLRPHVTLPSLWRSRGHGCTARGQPAPPAPFLPQSFSRGRIPPEFPPKLGELGRSSRGLAVERGQTGHVFSRWRCQCLLLPTEDAEAPAAAFEPSPGATPRVATTPSPTPRPAKRGRGPPPSSSSSSFPTLGSPYHQGNAASRPGRDRGAPFPSSSPLCTGVRRLQPRQMLLQLHIWEQSAPQKELHSLSLSFC